MCKHFDNFSHAFSVLPTDRYETSNVYLPSVVKKCLEIDSLSIVRIWKHRTTCSRNISCALGTVPYSSEVLLNEALRKILF